MNKKEVLIFLRDNTQEIPYPNMWDVLGGHVELDETPKECIIREMKEEIGLDLEIFSCFVKRNLPSEQILHFRKE